MLRWILDLFWTDYLWLPAGISWQDVANDPSKEIVYPECQDFLYQIPTTLVYLVLRYILQKYCFAPLGKSFGIKGKKVNNMYVTLQDQQYKLEEAYRSMPHTKDMTGLAKQLDLSERQVERWWRDRRSQDRASPLDKFCEHMWKLMCKGISTVIGVYILLDKEWLWDFDYLYIGYPHHGVTSDIWWYQLVISSYCWCILIMHFKEPAAQRSDAGPLFLHHVVELLLLAITWMTLRHRSMTIMVPLCDVSDVFLEGAKAMKKAKMETACIVTFIIASLAWFITRMYIYPMWLLYSLYDRGPLFVSNVPFIIYIAMAMGITLFILQTYWSWLILQVLYNYFAFGVKHDIRSSCSEESDNCCDHIIMNANGKAKTSSQNKADNF